MVEEDVGVSNVRRGVCGHATNGCPARGRPLRWWTTEEIQRAVGMRKKICSKLFVSRYCGPHRQLPCIYFALLLKIVGLLVHGDHAISRLHGVFFLVDFLSALYVPYNKLYWYTVYITLLKGLMSSNRQTCIECVSHLSNMCHHFGDRSIV